MPPFASGTHPAPRRPRPSPSSSGDIVTLNVGGQIFQTTRQTLSLAGPASVLADPPPFLDRDPHLFAPLLSLLRSGRLPASPNPNPTYSLPDLILEAKHYGIDPSLLPSSALPQFDALDLRRTLAVPLPGRDLISAVHVSDPDGSLHVAHGGKITSLDWSLSTRSTILTLAPGRAAVGVVDFDGIPPNLRRLPPKSSPQPRGRRCC